MSFLSSFYQKICCIDKPKYPDPYNFHFEGGQQIQNINQFQTNYIKTSKYRWYDFLIKAILLQYTRIANVYFLFIGILSSIPQISPVSSATIWIPIIFVLTLSIIRQGYQDYQRYKSDQQLNHQYKTLCFRKDKFIKKQWSQIKVGDIVKVKQNQFFPADLILLTSSQPNGNAFIQTSSLDGEKNLKIRKAYNQTNKYNCEQLLKNIQGNWIGSFPNKDLHKFSSKFQIQNSIINFQGDKQFLYRGAKLKNTKWIYGLTIYTGMNSKIMMNLNATKNKMSQIQKKLNYLLIYIFCVQIILCIIPTILYSIHRQKYQKNLYYIDWPIQTVSIDTLLMFFGYFILLSTFIPISLVISIEFVKVFQGYFINSDKLMYSFQRKKGVTAKSLSLNEQLGQIQYVCTDKTGTLTKNLMEFKIAMIGNLISGDQQLIKKCDLNGKQQSERIISLKKLQQLMFSQKLSMESKLANQYFQVISMAHQVLAQKSVKGQIQYHGPSPDQIALINFAKDLKYQFIDCSQSVITIRVNGKLKSYELLQTFSFTSERKRMSIIFRDENNQIKLYIKGADNVINQRLSMNQSYKLDQQINKCSSIGLRTLILAKRTITESQYQMFKIAKNKLQGPNKQQKYEELISNLQNQLTVLGSTAVLDKLQDYVPQTIHDLLKANIKVWMLTGDKLETAQNIGKNCNLIQKNFNIYRLSLNQISNLQLSLKKIDERILELQQNKGKNSLILEGAVLTHIIGQQQLQVLLLKILQKCQAVICCRLLPLQKAQIVNLLRIRTGKIVLTIGDGQNDVPMIKAANIGIGLYGQQGMGAVQASDYGLPQFRMLRRLIFVHGRWNYIRISQMILYFFYKNIIFTIPRLVFGFYSGFSAQRVFDDAYVALYNIAFTSLPLIVRAILDQDVNYIFPIRHYLNGTSQPIMKIVEPPLLTDHPQSFFLPSGYQINKYFYRLFPKIYFVGQQNYIFNKGRFIYWICEAILLGILITWISFQVIADISIDENGWSSDLWLTSLNLFSSLMLIVTLKLLMHTKFWSWYFILSITFFSIGFYIAYMWFSNYKAILNDHVLGTTQIMWRNKQTIFYLVFCGCLVIFIDSIVVSIDYYYGADVSKMRLAIKQQQQYNKAYLQSLSLKIQESTVNQNKKSQDKFIIQHQ